MMNAKKKKLTREDAAELYRDLHKTIGRMKEGGQKGGGDAQVAKQIAQAIRESMRREDATREKSKIITDESSAESITQHNSRASHNSRFAFDHSRPNGVQSAVALVAFFVLMKISLAAFEYAGVFNVSTARASLHQEVALSSVPALPRYSEEELSVLKQLDIRRVELREQESQIEQQARELSLKEQEFVVRLAELRELTDQLKISREKSAERRNGQLEQLSNVYGSMDPKESAQLIEQLDVSIALGLLERMPEKRIGQILSLMSAERALTITRMLSRGE